MIWAFPPGTPVLVTKLPKRAMYGTYLKKCIPPIPFPTPKQVVKKKIGIIHLDGCAHVFTKQIIWTYAWIWGFLAKNETTKLVTLGSQRITHLYIWFGCLHPFFVLLLG